MDSFKYFIQDIMKLVENITGIKPKIKEVIKNNGVKLNAIIIPKEGCNISPSIYLEPFYQEYQSGKSISEIAKSILNLNEIHKVNDNFDVKKFLDFESIKHNIIYKVVNTKENQELLNNIPHQEVLDLAKVCICMIASDSDFRSILINNEHLKYWQITENELLQIAEQNTPNKLPYVYKNMDKYLRELVGDEIDLSDVGCQIPMIILTNEKRQYGASCIFYNNVLNRIAQEIGQDLLIMPSSLHETIIIPYKKEEVAYLKSIVKEINDTQVSAEDRLSNNVYVFGRDDCVLKIAE